MKHKSFIGIYLIACIVVICASAILAILKMSRVLILNWIWVLCPVWGFMMIETAILSFLFGIAGIKHFIENRKNYD